MLAKTRGRVPTTWLREARREVGRGLALGTLVGALSFAVFFLPALPSESARRPYPADSTGPKAPDRVPPGRPFPREPFPSACLLDLEPRRSGPEGVPAGDPPLAELLCRLDP